MFAPCKYNYVDVDMTNTPETADSEFVALTTEIVTAYVSHNALNIGDLPKLIADVHAALQKLGEPAAVEVAEQLKPAVSVRKSVTPDHIICLEDGKGFKSIKRHLWMAHGLSPEDYRSRWSLPADYPLVAATYSEARSSLAKSIGLGRKPGAKVEKRGRRKVPSKV
jgi:predicted transcriptional regulator